jgi:hypothetical protein
MLTLRLKNCHFFFDRVFVNLKLPDLRISIAYAAKSLLVLVVSFAPTNKTRACCPVKTVGCHLDIYLAFFKFVPLHGATSDSSLTIFAESLLPVALRTIFAAYLNSSALSA